MNLIIASANYVGEIFTDHGLRFMQLNIPGSGKNATPVPIYVLPNRAGGESFDVFTVGCQILISGRIYPNRNDYRMYVVPTQPLQVVPKELVVNQVDLSGGVGFIREKKKEDLFAYTLMCSAPNQQLLGHSYRDSLGFQIESWADDAKRLESLLYVGRQMSLCGNLRFNTWTAQDGTQRSIYQVRVRASQYSVFGKNKPKIEVDGDEPVLPAVTEPPTNTSQPVRVIAGSAPPAGKGGGGVAEDDLIPF